MKKYFYLLPPLTLSAIFIFYQLPRLNRSEVKPDYPFLGLYTSFYDQLHAKYKALSLSKTGYKTADSVREALKIRQNQLAEIEVLELSDIDGKLIAAKAQIKYWSPLFIVVGLNGQNTKISAQDISPKSRHALRYTDKLLKAYKNFESELEKEFLEDFDQKSIKYRDYR